MMGKDKVVMELLAAYLGDKCLQNTIWWAINPESSDTGASGTGQRDGYVSAWALYQRSNVSICT
jgi:hypothetical protein